MIHPLALVGPKVLHLLVVGLAFATSGFGTGAVSASTLDEIKARGHLVCGVNQGLLGFARQEGGTWTGFDIDFCRAVAAALFHDVAKVDYVPLSAGERFEALRDKKVDLLARNSTWTLGREVTFDLTFVGISYYDGQGFMVPRSAGILSSLELKGKTVCVLAGTTNEANLPDYFNANNMPYETRAAATSREAIEAYDAGPCNVITSDISQLYGWRKDLAKPDEHVILPQAISKEPLGPVVRQDDPAWANLVRWVLFALVNAEELGISSQTIDAALASDKPAVRRFVGQEGDFGVGLGIANDWAAQIVRSVGHYGEIYDRNLGVDSALGIARGMNQLWNRGGIQYAPPMR